jgi:hypothetical protein
MKHFAYPAILRDSYLEQPGVDKQVVLPGHCNNRRGTMGRSLILWMVGVPIPVIILLWFFMH